MPPVGLSQAIKGKNDTRLSVDIKRQDKESAGKCQIVHLNIVAQVNVCTHRVVRSSSACIHMSFVEWLKEPHKIGTVSLGR